MTNAVLLRKVPLVLRDVSSGGCSIELRAPLQIGMVGWLEVDFEGERRFEWFRIARVNAGSEGVFVAGAEFLPLSAAGSNSLRSAIGQLQHVPASSQGSAGRSSGDLGNNDGSGTASADTSSVTTTDSARKVVDFVRRS